MLSVITTIDFKRRSIDLLKKLAKIHQFNQGRFEIVIGHQNRDTFWDKLFILLYARHFNIISVHSNPESVCNSLLRNKAVEQAKHEKLLLLDTDIFFDTHLFDEMANQLSTQERMIILPCFYLTAKGSKKIFKKPDFVMDRCIQSDRRYLYHLAIPSSVTFLFKQDYLSIGGFNEAYKGHGYEDLDFLIRLSSQLNCLTFSKQDILNDQTYRSPLFSVGYRKVLASVCLPYFVKGKSTFHLHHKNDKKNDKYYLNKTKNKEIFSQLVDSFEEYEAPRDEIELKNYIEFPILFDLRKGHEGRVVTLKDAIKFFL